MTSFQWSLFVWSLWGVAFLVLEIAAWQDWVPWNTLSWTVWQLSARSQILTMLVAGGMFVLTLHFSFGFPNRGRFKKERTEGKR